MIPPFSRLRMARLSGQLAFFVVTVLSCVLSARAGVIAKSRRFDSGALSSAGAPDWLSMFHRYSSSRSLFAGSQSSSSSASGSNGGDSGVASTSSSAYDSKKNVWVYKYESKKEFEKAKGPDGYAAYNPEKGLPRGKHTKGASSLSYDKGRRVYVVYFTYQTELQQPPT
jgi:hypothetical protein